MRRRKTLRSQQSSVLTVDRKADRDPRDVGLMTNLVTYLNIESIASGLRSLL